MMSAVPPNVHIFSTETSDIVGQRHKASVLCPAQIPSPWRARAQRRWFVKPLHFETICYAEITEPRLLQMYQLCTPSAITYQAPTMCQRPEGGGGGMGWGGWGGAEETSLPFGNLQIWGCCCNCILQKPTCCFLTITSRFFKNHFQMVWGEGRFLSELPREAPEVGGLDDRDPERSILCWL